MARVADSTIININNNSNNNNNVSETTTNTNNNSSNNIIDPSLPMGLQNLSPEERRRLEQRRNQERAVQDDKKLETRLAHVIIPLRMLCLLIFAIELLLQLDSGTPNGYKTFTYTSWYGIMIPLWISNLLKMFFHAVKLKQYYRTYRDNQLDVDLHGVGSSILHQVTDLGSIGTKYFIAAMLSGDLVCTLTWAFLPTWTAIGIGAFVKFFTPLDENVAPHVRHKVLKKCYDTIMYIAVSIMMPLIICTKVDGQNHNSWTMNFFPLWFLCLVLGIVAFIVLPIYACNMMFGETARMYHPRRERVRLVGMIFVFIYGIGTTGILFFVFLLNVTQRLDGIGSIKHVDYMVPLIIMFANLMIFSPIARYVLHRLSREEEIDMQNLTPEITDPNVAGSRISYGDNTEGLFSAISTPVFLLRSSSTLFQRVNEKDALIKGFGKVTSASVHPITPIENLKKSLLPTDDDDSNNDKKQDENENVQNKTVTMGEKEGDVLEEGETGKEETKEELPLCFICADNCANGVIMNCGHGGMCFRCGLVLARKVGKKICPICRSQITEVLKIDASATKTTENGELLLIAKEGMRVNVKVAKKPVKNEPTNNDDEEVSTISNNNVASDDNSITTFNNDDEDDDDDNSHTSSSINAGSLNTRLTLEEEEKTNEVSQQYQQEDTASGENIQQQQTEIDVNDANM